LLKRLTVELTMARPTLKAPKAETYRAALERTLELGELSLVVCDTTWRVLSTHNAHGLVQAGELLPELARAMSKARSARSLELIELSGGRSLRVVDLEQGPEHRVFIWLRRETDKTVSVKASQLLRKRYGLTIRAQQLLKLLAEGLSNRDIAERLGLREATVKTYLHELYESLGVRSRTAAIAQVRSSEGSPNSTDFR
jgi:ATP/maltotriose-dependent transcriptional regulator MalT